MPPDWRLLTDLTPNELQTALRWTSRSVTYLHEQVALLTP